MTTPETPAPVGMTREECLAAIDACLPENYDGALNEPTLADSNRLRAARATIEHLYDENARLRADLKCADERGQDLDDLCTANARALFRQIHPGDPDDRIEYEDSHEITQKAIEIFNQIAVSYAELRLAVGKKWPGETRHQTALRYIRAAEQSGSAGPHNGEAHAAD